MVGDIGLHIMDAGAERFERLHGVDVFFLRPGGDHDHVISVKAKLLCRGEADPSAGACHNCGLVHIPVTSSKISLRLPVGKIYHICGKHVNETDKAANIG